MADDRFVCPHHAGNLTLSPDACAAMWRRGQRAKPHDMLAPCRGCAIGAEHAGAPASAASAARPPEFQCTRCGKHSTRLIRGTICPSCYNRERERRIGRDRRGKPPRSAPVVLPLPVAVNAVVVVVQAAHVVEAALSSLKRADPGAVVSRYVPRGGPVQRALFPGL